MEPLTITGPPSRNSIRYSNLKLIKLSNILTGAVLHRYPPQGRNRRHQRMRPDCDQSQMIDHARSKRVWVINSLDKIISPLIKVPEMEQEAPVN
jgi:hypothetical protein